MTEKVEEESFSTKVFFLSPWQKNCQEWCRYPAGALSGMVQVPRRCPVRSGAEIGLLSLRLGISHGAALGDFLLQRVLYTEN